MLNRRHRRGTYPLAQEHPTRPIIKRLVALVIIGFLLFIVGKKVLNFFGVGNIVQRSAIVLSLSGQGTVSVSIEEQEFKRAENQLKIYPDDRIRTSGNATASMFFFDETSMRLDERTEILIHESSHGEKRSEISVELVEGSLWVATPTLEVFSGSIRREVRTPHLNLSIPAHTEAIISPSSFAVFAAQGLGIEAWVSGIDDSFFIGEGQQFSLPEDGVVTGDPYALRSALDPQVVRSSFIEESRSEHVEHTAVSTAASEATVPTDAVLIITEPENDAMMSASTIRVSGKVGAGVTSVRINGYTAAIEEGQNTFTQELSLPDEDTFSILIEAIGPEGTVLEEARRTVRRNREPPAPPTITSPAAGGQTYRTQREKFEITGTAPPNSVGIVVNDYRLQLFQPGDETWSYLASTQFDNLVRGENVYEVYAINKGGYESEHITLTIVLGEGEEGVIATPDEEEEGAGEPADLTTLPDNFPTHPGSLLVTGPTEGTFHTATGSEMLIEGTTSERTHTVWVNDYQLRLYRPGKTFWNYIADAKLGTLRRGTNVFHVVSRDEEGKILDEIDYTIYFNPREL